MISLRSLVTWVAGFATGRLLWIVESQGVSTFEIVQLSHDLRTTRLSIEEYSTREDSLKTEIRRSAHLDISVHGILLVETILVLPWLAPIVASGDSPSSSSGSSPQILTHTSRSGPLRPFGVISSDDLQNPNWQKSHKCWYYNFCHHSMMSEKGWNGRMIVFPDMFV